MQKFNSSFLLGAATAAHQVEGNNIYSDYWAQENMEHNTFADKSGIACDHYNRYKEDIKLLADAGLNTYRFSIEWARVEPKDGEFDENEIKHYVDVINCCKENGIEPFVTLFHFTSPLWLIKKGGWEADSTPNDFKKYVEYVMKYIGDKVNYIVTINEANMGVQVKTLMERFKKQMMAQASKAGDNQVQMGLNMQKMMENQRLIAEENVKVFGTPTPQIFNSTPRSENGDKLVMEAHKVAKEVIKSVNPNIKVGLSLSLHDIQALEGGEQIAKKEWDDEFTHYLDTIKDDDFLGVQNYTRSRYDSNGIMPTPEGAILTQMGYEYYPEALENVIRSVAKDFKGDLLVSENGIACDDDTLRIKFIDVALQGVQNCIKDNIPVKSYCYWSLMDNFEWQKGYALKFGLIAIDRETMKRIPKPSLAHLGTYLEK